MRKSDPDAADPSGERRVHSPGGGGGETFIEDGEEDLVYDKRYDLWSLSLPSQSALMIMPSGWPAAAL